MVEPQLLPPPGPSVHSIAITPQGQISNSASSNASSPAPQLFLDAIIVRVAVFIIGQKCNPALEIDADDDLSWHWVIHTEDSEKQTVPAATIRLIPAQAHATADDEKAVDGPNYKGSALWDHEEPYVMFGRLATVKEFRGRGYGRVLVREALSYAGRNGGDMVKDQELGLWKGLVFIHAQRVLEGWYKDLGFETDEGMGLWWEEGIEHVGMWKRVEGHR